MNTNCCIDCTVDKVIDIKEDNKCVLSSLLGNFENIIALFEDLKCMSIELERSLMCLRNTIETEGYDNVTISYDATTENVNIPFSASVAQYNNLVNQYLNKINVLLKYKIPSQNGLAVNVIKPWSNNKRNHIYPLFIKRECFNWVYFRDSIIVDNMSIVYPSIYDSSNFKNVVVPTVSPLTITKDAQNDVDDKYILVRSATLTLTIDLPSAPQQLTSVVVKDIDGNASVNNITVNASGTDTVNGGASDIINVNNQSIKYVYSGTDWVRIIITPLDTILLSHDDNIINVVTDTIGYTLHMPNPAFVPNGTILTFIDNGFASINNVILDGNTVLIDGAATYTMNTNSQSVSFIFNNNNWSIVTNVSSSNFPFVSTDVNVTLNVGCCTMLLPFVMSVDDIPLDQELDAAALVRYNNFKTLLSNTMPDKIHRIISKYEKNIHIIQQGVDFIINYIDNE